MSVLTGYTKYKRYIKTSSGYKLVSHWTSSNTVHMDDGNTAETNLGAIQGLTSSLATNNGNYALSASAGKSLQDQVTTLNSNLDNQKSKTITCNYSCLCDGTSSYTVDLSEYADAKMFAFSGYHNNINSGNYSVVLPINVSNFVPIFNNNTLIYLLHFKFESNKLTVKTYYSGNNSLKTFLIQITVIY